jgi:hypothetical protein
MFDNRRMWVCQHNTLDLWLAGSGGALTIREFALRFATPRAKNTTLRPTHPQRVRERARRRRLIRTC